MCAKGGVTGTLDLLQKVSREMDEPQIARLLRYKGPFAAGATALHLAVENFQEESAWLLLWIPPQLPADEFPEAARKDAESVSLQRSMAAIGDDIRLLKNEAGQTAGDVARTRYNMGTIHTDWSLGSTKMIACPVGKKKKMMERNDQKVCN